MLRIETPAKQFYSSFDTARIAENRRVAVAFRGPEARLASNASLPRSETDFSMLYDSLQSFRNHAENANGRRGMPNHR